MKRAPLGIGCVLLSACGTAASSSLSVIAPRESSVENEITVNRAFDDAWGDLVAGVSQGFFVIDNIEKDSRLLSVSFASDQPESYVDCGRSERTDGRGDELRSYSYLVAESSEYALVQEVDGYPGYSVTYSIRRETNLDGRASIDVARSTDGTTGVAVNVRYNLGVNVTAFYEVRDELGVVVDFGDAPSEGTTHSFRTNQPNQANWGTVDDPSMISCRSTGRLENEILAFVR